MALFKIAKGRSENINATIPTAVEGFCYFNLFDKKFYIDTKSGTLTGTNPTGERVALNANVADYAARAGFDVNGFALNPFDAQGQILYASSNGNGGYKLTALDIGQKGQVLKVDNDSIPNWSILTLSDISDITASAAEINILDGVTATTAEINILDGLTATTQELNYVDGVTSNIQTQLNKKAPLASPVLTGTPTAPTAAQGTNTTQIATTAFVKNEIINEINNFVDVVEAHVNAGTVYGTGIIASINSSVVGSSVAAGNSISSITNYKAGWEFRVISAGLIADTWPVEPGDWLLCIKDSNSFNTSDWTVIQNNLDITTTITSDDTKVPTAKAVMTYAKPKQTAVSSPSASGNTTAFIDTISQDVNGKITVTKKNLDTSGTWSGKAGSADKLNSNAGNSDTPIYFENGIPKACGNTLDVSIKGNAATATTATTATTANKTKASLIVGEKVFNGSTAIEIVASDLNAKTKQTAVTSPAANGSTTSFIDTISQNENGEIVATKKNLDTSGTWAGNAATADQFKVAKNIALTGDITGSASSVGGWSIATTLATVNENEGSFGPSADATATHGGTISIPQFTVNEKGLITAASNKTITLPSDKNTDTKVTQSAVITTAGEYPIILGYNTATTAVTNTVNKTSTLTYNPNTKILTAPTFKGALTGNADTATKFKDAHSVTLTGDVTGTVSSQAGWSLATTLANSGVTAGSYGLSSNVTPSYGETFNVPYITVDSKGRITAASTKTVKLPAETHYESKNIITSTDDGTDNAAAVNGTVYLNHLEEGNITSSHNIKGTGATTVVSDSNGNITINSTDTKSFTITATATDDDVVILTGTNGTNKVTFDAKHATKGPSTTSNTTKGPTADVNISGSGATGSIKIPKVTVDKYGHTTGLIEQTLNITMPTLPTKLPNPSVLKVGNKIYDGSQEITITAADLISTGAMVFLGTTTTAISDGSTTSSVSIGGSTKTAAAGNVVLYGQKEFVWNGSAWEELGNEGSYKIKQTAVSDPAASGTSITFIDSITQNAEGVIKPTKKTVQTATSSQPGLMTAAMVSKLAGISNSADAVSFVADRTSGTKIGTITINGTDTEIYVPTDTDTHYTTKLFATSSTGTTHAATTNGNTYLRLFDNSTARQSINIKGTGATSVTSDANGVITINSTNTTYTNASLGQGYGTCSTVAATTAKVVSLSDYILNIGGIVSVKFTYAVPANATMNINSKGAKNIYYRGAKIVANIIKAEDVATFIYDGTQYHLLSIDRWQKDIDEHTHTVSVTATGTTANTSITSKGTVNSTTITPSGTIAITSALAGTNVANYTPAGTITSTFTGTAAAHNHTFTGTKASHNHTFTGTAAEHNHTFTGTKATISTEYTPSGTVSSHSHSITSSTTTVNSITAVGTLPTLSATITNKTMVIDFSAGTLPTKGANTTVISSVNTNTGNATPTFTGTKATISTKYTPSGTIANKSITPAGTISETEITPAGTIANKSITPSGTVSGTFTGTGAILDATFTGEAASHSHTFTGTAESHKHTFTGSAVTATTSVAST